MMARKFNTGHMYMEKLLNEREPADERQHNEQQRDRTSTPSRGARGGQGLRSRKLTESGCVLLLHTCTAPA